jgi:curved DNA-binding protein CbpA
VSDPYRVLKVRRDAKRHEIRAAYRTLAWQWHPDHGGAPGQMIAINEAWRILGHEDRRAAYDAAVLRPTAAIHRPVTPEHGPTPEPERPPRSAAEPGVIDYGRYAGWSIDELAMHDPDYLQWLVRMPAGRAYAAQIREIFDRRERQRIERAPKPAARRGMFGLRTATAR